MCRKEKESGSCESPGARYPEPAPRSSPCPSRERCHSTLVLTGSRRSGPGAGLMQSARYLGRRLHYQPGPLPTRPEATSLPSPAAPGSLQVLLGPRPSATRWSPTPVRAPQLPRPGGSGTGGKHDTGPRGTAGHVSAPCTWDPARCPGSLWSRAKL